MEMVQMLRIIVRMQNHPKRATGALFHLLHGAPISALAPIFGHGDCVALVGGEAGDIQGFALGMFGQSAPR